MYRRRPPLSARRRGLCSGSSPNPLIKLCRQHHEAATPILAHVDCRHAARSNLPEDAAPTDAKHGGQLADT
jgi:hypothetical protein